MQGTHALKTTLFNEVLHWQIILVGIHPDGLHVVKAAGEVANDRLVELRSVAVAGVVGVNGHPMNSNIIVGFYLPGSIQLVIGCVWCRDNAQSAHCFAIFRLGQVGIAMLDILFNVVWIRVVALPLVNPTLSELVSTVLLDGHDLVKVRHFCFSNVHPHALFLYNCTQNNRYNFT